MVLPVAGGWIEVLDLFESVHVVGNGSLHSIDSWFC